MIGHWLARRRVALGFLAGVAALWFAQPTPRSLLLGAVIALCGEAIRIWAAGHLEKGREVTTTGPYRWTRHPLYAGSTIMGIGLAVGSASWIVAGLVAAYIALTIGAAISTEEAHMTQKFGESYPAYRAGRSTAGARRFSVRRAMRNREYRALLGLCGVLAVLLWKAL